MDFIIANWGLIAGAATALLPLLWVIAERTENKTDDKIVLFLREVWAKIPVGERNPKRMGRK